MRLREWFRRPASWSARSVAEWVPAFVASRLARGCRARTVESYLWALGKLPSGDLTLTALEGRLGSLPLAPESRRDVWRVWRTFGRWVAGRYGVEDITAGLVRPVVPPRPPRGLPEVVLRRALALASRRDRALLLLVLDTGLRLSEVAGLSPECVGDETVRVVGKGGREREVPISPAVRSLLVGLLPWRGRRGPLSRSGVEQAIRRALGRAGVTAGPHRLRHSMALAYIGAGGDVFSLQRILGHSALSVTEIYARADVRAAVAAHRRYSPVGAYLDVG